MLSRISTLTLGIALVFGLSSFDSDSKRIANEWEKVGVKVVDFRVERDVNFPREGEE